MTSNGAEWFVVWEDGRNWSGGGSDIFGARVSTGGAVLDPLGINIFSGSDGFELDPDVASDGVYYLVTWLHPGFSDSGIYARRVTSGGVVLDPGGVRVTTGTEASGPKMAYARTPANYLITFVGTSLFGETLHGRRVATSGAGIQILDSSDIIINETIGASAGPHFHDVASNGTNYLAVWTYQPGFFGDVFAARLRGSDGVVLDPAGVAIATLDADQEDPEVVSNGSDYLVVWMDGVFHYNDPVNNIFGVHVRQSDGRTLLYTPISTFNPINPTQSTPSVAWGLVGSGEGGFLVVWQDSRNSGTTGNDIFGTRVTGSRWLWDPAGIVISTAADDQASPDVVWNGYHYLVIWSDKRNGSDYNIYGTRVDMSGAVLDGSGIGISTAVGNQVAPRVTSPGSRVETIGL